jgi:hypothetical protein
MSLSSVRSETALRSRLFSKLQVVQAPHLLQMRLTSLITWLRRENAAQRGVFRVHEGLAAGARLEGPHAEERLRQVNRGFKRFPVGGTIRVDSVNSAGSR